MTQEEINKSISAAFDSVSLINQLNELESLNTEEEDTLNRNVEHLIVMMDKEWFSDTLTENQTDDINSLIN